ncbi:MAG: sodium:calcium antiporter [Nitrospirae bacterium]|nr:MAG: sodium:calcium antiporter [Nitrospirota bacterium]
MQLLLASLGFLLLVGGAEALVRGGARLARHLGVSPVVIGLTIVAIGTSAPELVVSLDAAWRGRPDIATGNVVGSNLANIGLILGVAGLLRPLPVALRLLRIEVPALVVATVAFGLFAADGRLGRGDGLALVLAMALLTLVNLRRAGHEAPEVAEEFETAFAPPDGVLRDALWVAFGLLALLLGGHLLVDAATAIARALGVPELVIGLTLVAVGTSLPELATAVVAVLRHEVDIAVGNVVGSNLFNLLAVAGPAALLRPLRVNPALLRLQLPALVVLTLALWGVLRTGRTVRRWEAACLLAAYAAAIVASGR